MGHLASGLWAAARQIGAKSGNCKWGKDDAVYVCGGGHTARRELEQFVDPATANVCICLLIITAVRILATTNNSTVPQEESKEEKISQAKLLVQMAKSAELFLTLDDDYYAFSCLVEKSSQKLHGNKDIASFCRIYHIRGQQTLSLRVELGALIFQEKMQLSDRETLETINKNSIHAILYRSGREHHKAAVS